MSSWKRSRKASLLALLLLLLPGWASAGSAGEQPTFQPAAGVKYVPGRLLVRFKKHAAPSDREQAHARVGGKVQRNYRIVPDLQLISLPPESRVSDAIRQYRHNPNVLYAEPDYVRSALPQNPNDPRFVAGDQWNLHNTGQNAGLPDGDIDSPEAWDVTTGSPSVFVGIIDSGIDINHPDLAANLAQLEANCADGVDNDGNGFIDDCRGLNAILGNNNVADDHSHGTHVAGIIGATGNNGIGVSGVNWTVRLVACKFLEADGFGSDADAIECLQYFQDLKMNRGINLVATNNSWGGTGSNQALYDAIQAHISSGILFVAAAGNNGTDNSVAPTYPSNFYLPNIIAVASTNRADVRSDFSNFGRHTVHLGAPGSEIVSTVPPALNSGSSYASFNGTSMAAPHVTGVAALLKAADNTRDWIAIKNLILTGSDDSPFLFETLTGKRLNAHGALTCTNSVVRSRLQPVGTVTTAALGSPVDLAALHINCAAPNGGVTVTAHPGETTVSLLDDGLGTDQVAGDGIYSGQFIPSSLETFTLEFPNGDFLTLTVLTPYGNSTTAYNYRTLSNANQLFLDDDSSGFIPAPFPIHFGGSNFTSIFANSNGNITFQGIFLDFINQPLPVAGPSALVAPFWDDLLPNPGTQNNLFWGVSGVAPHRELVVEWRDVEHFSEPAGSTVKFQVVFFESSNDILFNYADVLFSGGFRDRGGSATVGVQVAPSEAAQFSHNTPSLDDNMALLWQPTVSNPAPTLHTLLPTSADEGGYTFSIVLTGSDFLTTSIVRWNGIDLPTTFDNHTQLQAFVSENLITSPGTASITVFNPGPGGGESAPLSFTINDIPDNPVPSITAFDPTSTLATNHDMPLTVLGTNFVGTSVVRWQGSDLPTSYQDSGKLIAQVFANLVSLGQTVTINVFNPIPGGGLSPGVPFQIDNPVPSLSSISPSSSMAGTGDLILLITGSGFVANSVARWNGQALATAFLNEGAMNATVPASFLASGGIASVTVSNPAPAGGESAALPVSITDFTVGADPGTRTVAAGSSATYTITVTPLGGSFSSAVSLTCSAGVPSRASCSFQPSSLTPGVAAATSTLTISTAAQTSAMSVPPGSTLSPVYAALLPLPALVLVGGFSWMARRRLGYLLVALLLAAIVVHTGCGGSGGSNVVSRPSVITPSTPPGSYNITVRGASGSLERTTTVTLVVQ